MEAAPQSTEWTTKQWGKYGTSVTGTGTTIGTGKNNTDLIVEILDQDPADFDRAAQLCDDLSYGGYNDWFLPSVDEQSEMCWILQSRRSNGSETEDNPEYGTDRIGGFGNCFYWSSSQSSSDYARTEHFGIGYNASFDKRNNYYVRAIRAF